MKDGASLDNRSEANWGGSGRGYRLSACPHLCLLPLISCSAQPVAGGQVSSLRSLEGLSGRPNT